MSAPSPASTAGAVIAPLAVSGTSKICWTFTLGHGHAAQFHNFRENCPPEVRDRSIWVGMDLYQSGDVVASLPFVPAGLKRRRNEIWHFRQALKQLGPEDVIFVASWNLRLIPHMLARRSYIYVDFSPSKMRSLSPWYDHFFKKTAAMRAAREFLASMFPKTARGVFSMSDWAAEGIVADYGIHPSKVHTVLPGANLRCWQFIDRSDRPTSPVRILMVGGEFKRKGGDLLLKWAETVSGRNVEIDIATWPDWLPMKVRELMGNPTSFKRTSASLAPWLPHVRVHCGLEPNSPELLSLYSKADIFCLPTRGDFSSIASLEAMATGLPVVVGAVGGIPELIEEGRTGFLVPPNDDRILAEKLDRLICDPALRLRVGRAARKACEENLNIERQLRQIVAVVDRDASGPRPLLSRLRSLTAF
jgi:glycosyltransferase involved in cell wall biosynthesis